MSCDWRLVASEEELIEAATEGCRVIHCRNTTTISPAFFTSDALPLRSNLTLSGSANLRWVASLEDLQYVRGIYNRSTTGSENAKQLLPIASTNVLEMSGLELKASATSLEVFMEMLVDPAPGKLVLENTTWTVLDCTVQTLLYAYEMFPRAVRPDVFPGISQVDLNSDTILWDSDTFSLTIPRMPALPLPQVDIDAGNWTAAQTVSMYSFSIGCANEPGSGPAGGPPPCKPECTTRTVHTEDEMVQARLDDCRYIRALPKRQSNGTLADIVTLSRDSYEFDRTTAVNSTLSGILEVDILSTGAKPFNSLMIGRGTFMQLWYVDYIADFQQQLHFMETLKTGGPGKLSMVNTRFILRGCTSDVFPLLDQIAFSVLVQIMQQDSGIDLKVDNEQQTISVNNLSASVTAPGLGGGFSSSFSFEIFNLSVLCVDEWDLEDSLAHYALSEGQMPEALLPEARGGLQCQQQAGTPSVALPAHDSSAVPTSAVVGGLVGGAAALALAALLVVLIRRLWCKHQQSNMVDAEAPAGQADLLNSSEGSHPGASLRQPIPNTLLHDNRHLRALLEAEPCVKVLAHGIGAQVVAQASRAAARPPGSSPLEPRIPQHSLHREPQPGLSDPSGERYQSLGSLQEAVLDAPEQPWAGPVTEEGQQQQAVVHDPAAGWMLRSSATLVKCLPLYEGADLQVDLCRDVTLGRVLGEGHGSIVYEGWWRCGTEREQHVAVKMLDMAAINTDKEKEAFLASFRHELHLLTRIDHPCIVRCYGGCATPASACLLLEYMAGGTLAEYVHERRTQQPLSLGELLSITIQLCAALAYLHPVILHADVKPDNCLLTADGHVKLGDFGLSKAKWRSAVQPSRVLGTPPYTAPEMLHGSLVSEKCDIYSLAVLLWECCTNDLPWKDVPSVIQLYRLVKTEGRRPTLPEACHPSLAALITKCWHPNPELRPSAVEVARKAEILLATLVDSPDAEACPSGVATMERGMPQGAAEA